MSSRVEPRGCTMKALKASGICAGFEEFMRAESTPEGEKITPLTKAEDAQLQKEHGHAVIYAEP